ncbi:hypothetical protein AB0K20_17545 [Micromonospora matsumotoense]
MPITTARAGAVGPGLALLPVAVGSCAPGSPPMYRPRRRAGYPDRCR